MTDTEQLAIAIERMGGQSAAARTLGISQGLVWQWLNGYRPVGPKHCPRLEADGGVRCEVLRPDLVWTRDNGGQVTGHHIPLDKVS